MQKPGCTSRSPKKWNPNASMVWWSLCRGENAKDCTYLAARARFVSLQHKISLSSSVIIITDLWSQPRLAVVVELSWEKRFDTLSDERWGESAKIVMGRHLEEMLAATSEWLGTKASNQIKLLEVVVRKHTRYVLWVREIERGIEGGFCRRVLSFLLQNFCYNGFNVIL